MTLNISYGYQKPSPLAEGLLSQLPPLPVGVQNGLCLELLLPHGNVVKFVERTLRSLHYANERIAICATATFDHISMQSIQGDREAIEQLHHIAHDGDARAQYTLGLKYLNGFFGVTKDREKARNYFQLAADQGHEAAPTLLQYMSTH